MENVALTPEAVRDFRIRMNMSQRAMADFCGITQGQLSKIEAGTRTIDGALEAFLKVKMGICPLRQALEGCNTEDGALKKLFELVTPNLP